MRLFLLLILTGCLAFATLPGPAPAAESAHSHDCVGCAEHAEGHDRVMDGAQNGAQDGVHAGCLHVATCVAATIPDLPGLSAQVVAVGAGHDRPTAVTGRAVTLPLDLPPPRA